jgi:sodium/potassium/calcium exchanger 6
MLNILLGVGIGGAWMIISSANEKHQKHPGQPMEYKTYKIEVGGTLLISAVTVLITLVTLLIVVPWNKWVMSRKIGWGLIAIWTVGTIVNLVVEVTGTWSDVR